MPTSARDAVTDDALYPDQLPGRHLQVDPERLDGELMTWDAQDPDDREDLPDGADFGRWLPVVDHSLEESRPIWAAAPRDLLEQLLDTGISPGDSFEVLGWSREDEEHAPHLFEDVIRVGPDGGPPQD